MNPTELLPRSGRTRPASAGERGFSFVEVLIVVAMITILLSVAVVSVTSTRQAYAADNAAGQIIRLLREAQGRALSQRQRMRLTIDRDTRQAIIVDENTLAAGAADDEQIRLEVLPPSTDLAIQQPANYDVPAAPFNYAVADFTTNGGEWTIYFQSDGSATDATGTPLSATFFFYPPSASPNKPANSEQVRALTLFGPTGSARLWKYRKGKLAAEVN